MNLSKSKIINYIKWQGLAMSTFVVVYGLCNYYASKQEKLYPLYFEWELNIPHIPLMMLIYRTLDIILIGVLFWLNEENMKKFSKAMIFSIFVAAPIFLIFPTQLGFPRLENFENFEIFYKVLYSLDKPHNLFPSMHVTYAALGLWTINKEHIEKKYLKYFTSFWLVLICSSIILVHRHHILDIPSGLLLALISYKIFISKN